MRFKTHKHQQKIMSLVQEYYLCYLIEMTVNDWYNGENKIRVRIRFQQTSEKEIHHTQYNSKHQQW
jgi:hypothetical protein